MTAVQAADPSPSDFTHTGAWSGRSLNDRSRGVKSTAIGQSRSNSAYGNHQGDELTAMQHQA